MTVNQSSHHKADQNFFVTILTSVCCNVLRLIWNEKLGMKPSPSVPKTLHSMPTFAQNVHPYRLIGIFYPQKSAQICTCLSGQLQKWPDRCCAQNFTFNANICTECPSILLTPLMPHTSTKECSSTICRYPYFSQKINPSNFLVDQKISLS